MSIVQSSARCQLPDVGLNLYFTLVACTDEGGEGSL